MIIKKSPVKHVAPKIQIFLNGSSDRNGKEALGGKAGAEEEKQINVTLHVKGTAEFVATVIDKTRTSITRIQAPKYTKEYIKMPDELLP